MVDIMKGPILYLVTDRRLCKGKGLVACVEEALAAGAGMVQLREKEMQAGELLTVAGELGKAAARHGALFIVNGRLDVALIANADGIHLGQSDFSPEDARPFLPKGKLIGVSTHSLKEAQRAEAGGADYITFGPVCHTPSKAAYGPPVGFDELQKVTANAGIPVFAIGGIKKGTVKDAVSAGAKGAAVITAVFDNEDIGANVKELLCRMKS